MPVVKKDIIILHMCAKFQVQAIFRSWDIGSNGGQKGSKKGDFEIFSKTSLTIWFHLLVKEDLIILHMCAKFQVQANLCLWHAFFKLFLLLPKYPNVGQDKLTCCIFKCLVQFYLSTSIIRSSGWDWHFQINYLFSTSQTYLKIF